MRMTPVRFVGHKIGPFDHIELNWEKESRYTLIVAENGMGKTTLVAAMAACLAGHTNYGLAPNGANENLLPNDVLYKFGYHYSSYVYFELEMNNERVEVFRWGSPQSEFQRITVPSKLGETPTIPDIENMLVNGIQTVNSRTFARLTHPWFTSKNVNFLAAAYGTNRDIKQSNVHKYRELDSDILKNILNPFASIPSEEIFQWVAHQHINHALALLENQDEEAQAYLSAIRQVEQLLSHVLDMPITFELKRNPFRLEVQQNGKALTIDQLSDGTRTFLSWPLDYLMRASRVNWANPADSARAPGLILVDEIDAHLHPEWQRRVMLMVNQLLPETYIIATTHSPFVLGATDDAQVFRIYKDEDGTLQVESSFDELYGYPADLILQKQFVPSLYPIETERKLERLSELARQVAANTISESEKKEHDTLLRDLSKVNPWLNSLLGLSQIGGSTL